MMSFDQSVERAERRALLLTRKHGVYQKNVMGAYSFVPLRHVEYLFHEVSHWMTLGRSIKKLPRQLSKYLGEVFDEIPDLSANSLEIDTAIITYIAGYLLGFWTDPGPIVGACRRNLKGLEPSFMSTDDDIYKIFESRWSTHRSNYRVKAQTLAKWFRPSAEWVALPESSFP
jgi:hypothetical protein